MPADWRQTKFKALKRPNCRFISGEVAYVGMTGLIVDKIDKHFRLILDKPVGDLTEVRGLPRDVALIRPAQGWVPPVGFEAAMVNIPELLKPAADPAPAASGRGGQAEPTHHDIGKCPSTQVLPGRIAFRWGQEGPFLPRHWASGI